MSSNKIILTPLRTVFEYLRLSETAELSYPWCNITIPFVNPQLMRNYEKIENDYVPIENECPVNFEEDSNFIHDIEDRSHSVARTGANIPSKSMNRRISYCSSGNTSFTIGYRGDSLQLSNNVVPPPKAAVSRYCCYLNFRMNSKVAATSRIGTLRKNK